MRRGLRRLRGRCGPRRAREPPRPGNAAARIRLDANGQRHMIRQLGGRVREGRRMAARPAKGVRSLEDIEAEGKKIEKGMADMLAEAMQ